jgi:hypothetical protein
MHTYTSYCTWFNLPIGLFTVLPGVNVPVPCRAFMTRCAHSHVWLVRVCGYIAIVHWPPRPTGVVTGIPVMYNTHSQTCYVVRRSCHGQTRAVVLRFPLWPSCEMMMCSFASDRLPGRIMGTLAAGYDKRCIQDHLVTELSNRTGSSHNTYTSHLIEYLIITIVACNICT